MLHDSRRMTTKSKAFYCQERQHRSDYGVEALTMSKTNEPKSSREKSALRVGEA